MYCNVLEFNVKKAPLKCARKSAGAASWAGKNCGNPLLGF